MRLHLVRHLAPLVAPGVCYGRTNLATDRAAQRLVVPRLRIALPAGAPIYTSPLQRCTVLADALGAGAHVDARLAELDFGSWEMRRWEDIARSEIDAWAANPVAYCPGGVDSVLGMASRVAAFHADLRRARVAEAVVVCHAGTIRLLMAHTRFPDLHAMAQAAAERPHAIGYGEVVTINCV